MLTKITLFLNCLNITGCGKNCKEYFITTLKSNIISLDDDLSNDTLNELRKKISFKKVITYYQVSNHFKSKNLDVRCFSYIKRLFTTISDDTNFLELEYNQVVKIISSSELVIDSQLEVVNAADSWIKYDFEKRSKYAKDLLLKVRLPVVSEQNLSYIAKMDMSFNKVDDCAALLKEISQNNRNFYHAKLNGFYSNKYSSLNSFNIIVSGGSEYREYSSKRVNKVDCEDFSVVKEIASMKSSRNDHKTVYCGGNIFVFGGFDENNKFVKPVVKYSLTSNRWDNKWVQVAEMSDKRWSFCACSFMNQILLIGGCKTSHTSRQNKNFYHNYHQRNDHFDLTSKLDTKSYEWSTVSKMNVERSDAAVAIFEGRVVVTGGQNNEGILRTVTSYNHLTDKWTSMPSMIEERFGHGSVANRNKLYVIGRINNFRNETCEVFDSFSNKFVALKSIQEHVCMGPIEVNIFGSKLLILQSYSSYSAYVFDLENEEHSHVEFKGGLKTIGSSRIVIPKIQF